MPSKLRLRDWDVLYQRAAKMEGVDQQIRADLEAEVPDVAREVWTDAKILTYARTPQDRMALAGSRVRSSARSTTLTGATRGPRWWHAVEFGDAVRTFETYRGRRGGKSFQVKRRTQEQLPARNKQGRVLYRYGREALKQLVDAYRTSIVGTLRRTLEGR